MTLHIWGEKSCKAIPYAFAMYGLMYAMLCDKQDICFIVDIVKLISIKSKSKTLDNYQVYTQVSLENKGLCVYVPKNWDSSKGRCDDLIDTFYREQGGSLHQCRKSRITSFLIPRSG